MEDKGKQKIYTNRDEFIEDDGLTEQEKEQINKNLLEVLESMSEEEIEREM